MIQLQLAKLMWVLYLFFEYINIPFPWQQHAHTVEVNVKPYLYWDFFLSQIIRSTGNFLIKFDPKFLVSSYYSAAIFTPLTIRTYQLILKVYSNYKKVVLIFFTLIPEMNGLTRLTLIFLLKALRKGYNWKKGHCESRRIADRNSEKGPWARQFPCCLFNTLRRKE